MDPVFLISYEFSMENHENIKAIVFDFWGVFVIINPPMNRYLKSQGYFHREKFTRKEIHDLIVLHILGKINEEQFFKKC